MNISYKRGAVVFLCTSLLLPCTTLAQTEDRQTKSLESAVEEGLQKCEADGARFCSNVNPGQGRALACLQAYVDQVSEECRESLAVWQRPDPVLDYQTIRIYPTLEDRELGEQNIDETGERVIWKQKLPFFAQQVVDLGFDLPNPYGVAIIPALIHQDLILQDLAIGINGPPDREIDFVDFGTPNVENAVLQLKVDAWVLPFLNVFATVGRFTGDANVPLKFEGSDLFPGVCNVTPNAPICVRTYSAI